jgi:long-chain acyl-CoA synthetase
VLDNINKSGGIKKILFYWAKKIGEEVARKKDNKQPISGYLKFKYNIADKLVFSKIRERTGGRLFFAVSGSSPLAKHISYFFYGIGLPVLEGYGLTEASPIVSSNTIHKDKIGTVGTTFKWVKVKTADDGELYVKGPNIMLGYYKNEEATKETINDDGWLKTGDIAEINKEGFIKIIDRKKDMFKTSGGKYIVPQKIENMAKINQFIAEFVVIAENMRYVSALLLPNFDKLKDYAKDENITYSNNSDLITNEKIKNLYQNIIDQEINPHLARYETIKKFVLIEKPFTIENNELTPSLKVKRRVVNQHYKDLINRLYEE